MSVAHLPPDFSAPILVVRRDNIGDLVCTTPLIDGLRRSFPRARIEALVNSYNAQVLLGNPAVDRINVYTKLKHRAPDVSVWSALVDRAKLLRELRSRRFGLVILARSSFDRHGLAFVRWLGVPRVLGFSPDGNCPSSLSWPVEGRGNEMLHEVEALARLASAIGVSDALGSLRVFPDPARVEPFRRGLSSGSPIVGVHISAREPSRRLGDEKWVTVIRGIHRERPQCVVVLFWSPGSDEDPRHPGDDQKASRILRALGDLPVIASPTRELEDLVAGLAACDFFVGADGGALHIAAGLGLACVALFENSLLKQVHWAPWKVPSRKVAAPTFAVGDIDPETIVEAFVSLAS